MSEFDPLRVPTHGVTADDHVFRLLVQSVKDYGIFLLDPSGHVVSWNEGAERIKGYSADAIIGQHFSRFYTPEDVAAGKPQHGLQVAEEQGRFEAEGWRVRKDGTRFWANVVITALHDDDGRLVGFAKVTRDLTERHRVEEAERAARQRAEETNRAKDEFVATISHELRTPLNVLVGELWRLQHSALDAEATQRAWAAVDRNLKVQVRLVEDLLEVSRAMTGTLKLELRPTDLASVVDAAIDIIRATAHAKGIAVTKRVRSDVGLIMGDPVRLQQIVWNLLSNAVKFTKPGGAIHIELLRAGVQAQLTVRDNGIGIAPEFIPKLFLRFTQADGSTTRTHSGLGVGLAIVKDLVAAHGGEVRAHSEGLGQGATFEVCFPIPAVVGAEDLPPVHEGQPRLDGVRVLIVDDERDAREAVCAVLRHFGAEALAADSTRDALERIASFRPDVLLADIAMPSEDGYALIERIRQFEDPAVNSVAAAALTAFTATEDRLRVLSAGYQLHVGKPVDPVELALSVAHLAKRIGSARRSAMNYTQPNTAGEPQAG